MEQNELKTILEALLFASGQPLTVREIKGFIDQEVPTAVIHEALEKLQKEFDDLNRSFSLVEVAGGYHFRTKSEYGEWILKMELKRPPRLSKPALEALAIIAYRQPVTRPEIEEIRGVDSGGVIKNVLERRLIKVIGKKDEPGRPLIYATSPDFLSLFNLRDLSDLPSLKEFEEKVTAKHAIETESDEDKPSLFEEAESAAIKMGEIDEEGDDALRLLEEGLKQLKQVEKGLEKPDEEVDPSTGSGQARSQDNVDKES